MITLINLDGVSRKKTEAIFISNELEVDRLKKNLALTAAHLCLCGCGNLSVTPLNSKFDSSWNMTEKDGMVSFSPSILNTNCPNRYHYIITDNVANVV